MLGFAEQNIEYKMKLEVGHMQTITTTVDFYGCFFSKKNPRNPLSWRTFFSGIHTFGQSKMYELLNMPLIPHYVPLIPHGASTHGPRLHVGHLIPQLRSQ